MPGTCIRDPLRCSGERGRRQPCENTHRDVRELLNSTQWPNLLKKRNSGKLSEMQPEFLPAFQPLPAYSAAFHHLDTQKPCTRIAWLPAHRLSRKSSAPFLSTPSYLCCLSQIAAAQLLPKTGWFQHEQV